MRSELHQNPDIYWTCVPLQQCKQEKHIIGAIWSNLPKEVNGFALTSRCWLDAQGKDHQATPRTQYDGAAWASTSRLDTLITREWPSSWLCHQRGGKHLANSRAA